MYAFFVPLTFEFVKSSWLFINLDPYSFSEVAFILLNTLNCLLNSFCWSNSSVIFPDSCSLTLECACVCVCYFNYEFFETARGKFLRPG